MSDDDKLEALNSLWKNFCISDTYEPGSTIKPFTVATALETGALKGDETFYCGGMLHVGDHDIHCINREGHGTQTIKEAVQNSCNVALMQIGALIGKDNLSKYQHVFGFGELTGIDLPGDASTEGLLYTPENMDDASLATNSFGQNFNVTMTQLVSGFCSLINGGDYYEPHVVKQILNDQGSVVKEVKPKLVRETVSESTSSFIKDALFRTVSEGTGKAAAVEGYEIAGKTGTAEKIPRSAKNYLLSFCGFAPAYDPQVLVYVTVDTPHVEDQPHSIYASSVFSKIMGDILPYLNVFPSVDFEQQSEAAAQLPEAEGITDNSSVTPETEAEPKVYETEEYIEPGADSDLPEDVPESTETDETGKNGTDAGGGYVPPAQTVPETSASESSQESSEAESESSTEAEKQTESAGESTSQAERETMSATSSAGE